jgi:hypothetical protein
LRQAGDFTSMVNARLTWDSNAGRVGRGPMP